MTAVAQLRRALDDLAAIPEAAIQQAAKAVEEFAATQGRPVTIKGKRYPLKAVTKYDRRGADVIHATVFGTPTGFWVWQNTGTRGGYKIPKRVSRRPRYLFGRGWAHPVLAPVTRSRGISARGAWRRVDSRARVIVPEVFVAAVHEAIQAVA